MASKKRLLAAQKDLNENVLDLIDQVEENKELLDDIKKQLDQMLTILAVRK